MCTHQQQTQHSYGNKSNFGLFTLIANHLVSAIDALNIARLNNIALKENLSMRVKIDPGSKREAYGIAFTQKFQ